MMQTTVPANSPPSLAELLTREQQQVLALKLAEVISDGFGEVAIHIRNGHLRFVKITSSYDLTAEKSSAIVPAETER